MNQLKMLCVVVALVAPTSACAGLMPVLRSVKDIAYDICSLTGTEQLKAVGGETIDGMSVSDWCKQAKVIKPFMDDVLASKLSGASRITPAAASGTDAETN